MFQIFHDLELDFIRTIHQFRMPLLDQFFKFFDYFDRQEFFFILVPIIWLSLGWKNGLRLFYILLLSSVTNHVLKSFFLSPRPFHIDPTVGIIQVKGLGFPSGAAQSVIILSGILLMGWKSLWKWPLAFTYILLVSFSRIYLGLHFPSDILGGWVVGFGLLAIYVYAFPPIERRLERLKPLSLLLLSQAFPLLLMIWGRSSSAFNLAIVAMGIGAGLYIVNFYRLDLTAPNKTAEYIARILIGVLGTFACYFLTQLLPIPDSMRYWLLGLWASLGSVLMCRQFSMSS
jgi:undecaprenyl-diphosphatase